MSQSRPEPEAVGRGAPAWELEEAGSYGYSVRISLDRQTFRRAIADGLIRVRLTVSEGGQRTRRPLAKR